MAKLGSFEYIDKQIRKGSVQELGNAFEQLCKFYLENAPKYRGEFKNVWHWKDWPGRWGPDTGIDLIAETIDGDIWAIQAKGINPERSIPKRELDSFLSDSNRPGIKFRLIIATTDDIGANARRTIEGQQIPVGFVLRGDLLGEELQWPDQLGGKIKPRSKKNPRPHQEDAIRDVLKGFKSSKRGKLILACGTGKTLTSLWINERLESKRTLFLVPSLSLINQTLLEWSANSKHDFERIVVCSDDTVTQSGDDHAVASTADLGIEVTTDAKDIAHFLRKKHTNPVVVFCTYQSSDRITVAHKLGAPAFDLVIADEAHRTTGHVESNFSSVLNEDKIKADKRLFMTATPRYFTDRVIDKSKELEYEMASMDDETKYGPVFHQLSFGQAIKKNLLSNYQVVVISASEKERKMAEEATLVRTTDGLYTDARTFAAQVGLAKAIKKYNLHKIITFHSSIAKAKRFADVSIADSLPSVISKLPKETRPSGEVWTSHISGQTPSGKRKTLLNQFASFPNTTCAILTNCACLGEGVDVPTLDGVAFIDPKRSQVDIIQAVGRVIRKAEGVGVGTIVIPVFIDESEDEDAVLTSSAFKPVWQVIKALRAHDEVLADELDELRLKLGKRSAYGGKLRLPSSIKVDIPTIVFKDFEQAFNVRTIETTTNKTPLTIEKILGWADEHRKKTGEYPRRNSGLVNDDIREKWSNINDYLVRGLRGLSSGSSLARLLAEKRGVKNEKDLPDLEVPQILKWIDDHHKETGVWPNSKSGQVLSNPEEKWSAIDDALYSGIRGLPGGSSLPRLLSEKRGVRNIGDLSTLTIDQILSWADEHHKRIREWPRRSSGQVYDYPEESWSKIDSALIVGLRGLPGGSSLPRLLSEKRGVRNQRQLPQLIVEQILKWADDHHKKTGKWPNENSGEVEGAPGEKWGAISAALSRGVRGLPGGSSLPRLLSEKRGIKNKKDLPSLNVNTILKWADEYYKRTGEWPNSKSGQVLSNPEEKWSAIDGALYSGIRGLSGGSSLLKLLSEKRGVRNRNNPPPLKVDQILNWADDHYKRTGKWPNENSGEVEGAPGEKWGAISMSLAQGGRGLEGGSSLAKLLNEKRGVRNIMGLPDLEMPQILKWIDAYNKETGVWPNSKSGQIDGTLGEKWVNINVALNRGLRGLSGGSSLPKLLSEKFGVRNKKGLKAITVEQILNWADEYYSNNGKWPNINSGKVANDSEETWKIVDGSLSKGSRGLSGGSSLAKLLIEKRGIKRRSK